MAVPNVFTNGTTADATEVNANFDYITDILVRDDARGITPVQTSWNTAPTNLGNVTDGSATTVTTSAVNNVENNTCYLTIDLGDTGVIRHYVGVKYDFTINTVGNASLSTEIYNGTSWLNVSTLTGKAFSASATGTIDVGASLPPNTIVEQIRFKCLNAGAKIMTIEFYSAVVW